jgi:hypothetical protein
MRTYRRWFLKGAILLLLPLVIVNYARSNGDGDETKIRWDIISVNFAPPFTVSAGGIASALASDGSHITLTGSGTFVAPAGGDREEATENDGSSNAATGGGTWALFASGATTPSATGTYVVTGLVRWEPAPFPPGGPPPREDLIEPTATRSTGLAVLRITYSDGERGILVVSCEGVTSPPNMFEGVTATKGFVDYKSPVAPVGGVDANRTLFHVK